MNRPYYMNPGIAGSTAIPTTSKGNENWKYTNLKPIANTNFNPPNKMGSPDKEIETKIGQMTLADLEKHVPLMDTAILLVFIDGYFAEYLSSAPINFRNNTISVEVEQSFKKWQSVPAEDVFSNINNGAFYCLLYTSPSPRD